MDQRASWLSGQPSITVVPARIDARLSSPVWSEATSWYRPYQRRTKFESSLCAIMPAHAICRSAAPVLAR